VAPISSFVLFAAAVDFLDVLATTSNSIIIIIITVIIFFSSLSIQWLPAVFPGGKSAGA